jgi:hypothetical protein
MPAQMQAMQQSAGNLHEDRQTPPSSTPPWGQCPNLASYVTWLKNSRTQSQHQEESAVSSFPALSAEVDATSSVEMSQQAPSKISTTTRSTTASGVTSPDIPAPADAGDYPCRAIRAETLIGGQAIHAETLLGEAVHEETLLDEVCHLRQLLSAELAKDDALLCDERLEVHRKQEDEEACPRSARSLSYDSSEHFSSLLLEEDDATDKIVLHDSQISTEALLPARSSWICTSGNSLTESSEYCRKRGTTVEEVQQPPDDDTDWAQVLEARINQYTHSFSAALESGASKIEAASDDDKFAEPSLRSLWHPASSSTIKDLKALQDPASSCSSSFEVVSKGKSSCSSSSCDTHSSTSLCGNSEDQVVEKEQPQLRFDTNSDGSSTCKDEPQDANAMMDVTPARSGAERKLAAASVSGAVSALSFSRHSLTGTKATTISPDSANSSPPRRPPVGQFAQKWESRPAPACGITPYNSPGGNDDKPSPPRRPIYAIEASEDP